MPPYIKWLTCPARSLLLPTHVNSQHLVNSELIDILLESRAISGYVKNIL